MICLLASIFLPSLKSLKPPTCPLEKHETFLSIAKVNVFVEDLMSQLPRNPLGLKIGDAVATWQK